MTFYSLSAQEVSFLKHTELGNIHWFRNYDYALAKANEENKPLLIFFQEVPGCSTCRNYGEDVLTHPHIVEAIESHFVPLCVFNNKGGKDKEVLNLYNEPTWNNPVVRVVNGAGKNIVDRLNGNYSSAGLVQTINTAITESGNIVPPYLVLLEKELLADIEEVFLSMYCFWTGEKEISAIPGVIGTQAGFMNGKEVVKVDYDINKTNTKKIRKAAAKKSCGDDLYTSNTGYRMDSESKYYLQHSALKHVPMTALQATQVNRALALKEDALMSLSPRQLDMYTLITTEKEKTFSNYIEKDFIQSWYEATK